MTGTGETRKEARLSMSIMFNAKTVTKIATWSVMRLYQCGRTEQVMRDGNYKLDILCVSNMRWTGQGRMVRMGRQFYTQERTTSHPWSRHIPEQESSSNTSELETDK